MATTTKDIADEAGVSVTTVNIVLSGKSAQYKIDEGTQKRVKRVAEKHSYRLSRSTQSLRLKRSRVIGVIVPDIGIPFFAQLVRALELEAVSRRYQLMVISSGDEASAETKAIETLMARSIDGLILATSSREPVEGVDVPLVYIDRPVEGDDVNVVVSDQYTGSVAATEHLVGKGCKRIAYLGRLDGIPSSDERRRGFSHTVEKAGLPYDETLVYKGAHDRASATKGMGEILDNHGGCPDGIFTVSFDLFEGVLDCLYERYGKLPTQVQFATFDDHPLVEYLPVSVFSVRQDSESMAAVAMEQLLAEVQGLPILDRLHELPVHTVNHAH